MIHLPMNVAELELRVGAFICMIHLPMNVAELELQLKDLRSQRADMFEKYEVERSEASQLNAIQDEIDRCVVLED